MKRRDGIKFAFAEPDLDMIIVSMLEFHGFVYVATQKGVYRIEDDKVVRLEIVDKTPLSAPDSLVGEIK